MKRNGKFLLSLLALVFLLSCTQTPEQIDEKGRRSTVLLMIADADRRIPLGMDGRCSGFFVDHDQIVTNIHCVAGVTKIRAKLVGTETFYDIEGVTASDPQNDLVILEVAGKGTPLPLGDSDVVQGGEPVIAVGNPQGEEGQISQGKVYSRRDSDKWLRLKLKLSPGNSGGPVLNSKGEVIGVVVAVTTLGDSSYALPSNTLKELLNKSESVESLTQWQKKKSIQAHAYEFQAQQVFTNGQNEDDQELYKKAIELLDKSIGLHPLDISYNLRGRVKSTIGRYQAAIKDYDKAIRLNPDDAHVYNNRGFAKVELGNHKAAIKDFDKAIQLNPDYTDAYFKRGNAKGWLGDYEAAIADYDKAIELNPAYADAYKNRGLAKQALGQQEAAEADFKKAKELEELNVGK